MTAIEQAIRNTLNDAYGLEGDIRRLPGEYDLNFVIKAASRRFVFKLMRADCDVPFVEMQIAALQHVGRSELAGIVPEVICTKAGAPMVMLADGGGDQRVGWLLSFLPGTLMAELEAWTPPLAASIGNLLGRLDRVLESFDHPLLDRVLKWDLRQAGWISQHLDSISEPTRRAHIKQISARFVRELKPRLDALPRHAIYNDANDMNVFVSGKGDQLEASGLVDFGDMIRSPRVCEPAIALAYAMMGPADPLARGVALARAYHQAFPLSNEEAALLAPLVKVRLAITVANAAIQRAENPHNRYLAVSEAPAWRLLDYLDAIGDEAFEAAIRAACMREVEPSPRATKTSLLARRRIVALGNQSLFYEDPLHIVSGRKHFLHDADGVEYLDVYNNVPHVGHAHPHVVDAVTRQMATINTNTRYLQEVHLDYAERMLARLPAHLSKIVFLSSASEANELALRLARAATGARDMLVMDHCYHGNTTGAMDISPYKFGHAKSLNAAPDWVHVVAQPDVYRGIHRGAGAAEKYIDEFRKILGNIERKGRKPAGFICECLPSVGGQIVLPPGYLNTVYAMVRAAGGICIADDVQTGLGRLGHWFCGFEQQECMPDVVVWGKPLGNGFPLAAVAMTRPIADAFARGPEFFATFGGSSAACAAGAAVLDVMNDENLQARALKTGEQLLTGLAELAQRHAIIGDVRGFGLFLGVDLVRDRARRDAATVEARRLMNRLREKRVLVGLEGPENNVLKIRPPMSFDSAAAEQFLTRLDEALADIS
ncbi:MAG TPA: aminotransferase class III-fold pyridoxal phosphate-dependent enzyme [Dokdonella sp.]|uniref:aminotransferase class III-fold pyridoxal phosphate-dependent enzyme n=1 Tax=Dokdonella sp. TaxID=2291710 RepID=UPI002D80D3EA|nr:aminotransferase class III-fold pyridoxal phosphate-dependent enzyme [Dokdonella sp.]HET9034136.1 aminotransferase class III-fold pyridoxal phosphate-dependent enzyme [Dokdonella sp.]